MNALEEKCLIKNVKDAYYEFNQLPRYIQIWLLIKARYLSHFNQLKKGILSYIAVMLPIMLFNYFHLNDIRIMSIYRAIERKYGIDTTWDNIKNFKEFYIYLSIMLKRLWHTRKKDSKYRKDYMRYKK